MHNIGIQIIINADYRYYSNCAVKNINLDKIYAVNNNIENIECEFSNVIYNKKLLLEQKKKNVFLIENLI